MNPVMPVLLVLLAPLSLAYGEVISAQDGGSGVTIQLDEGELVSYSASHKGSDIVPVDPKLKERSYGFIISDRAAGFLAVVKATGDGYVIKTKIQLDGEAIVVEYAAARGPADPDAKKPAAGPADPDAKKPAAGPADPDAKEPAKKPAQRDLLGSTILDPEDPEPPAKRTDDAEKKLEEDLKKLEEQNRNALQSKKDDPRAVTSYEDYKRQTANKTEPAAPEIDSFELFAHVPHVKLGTNLVYEALAAEPGGSKYVSKFDASPGTGVPGVSISAVVTDGAGKVVDEQDGTTDAAGRWAADPVKLSGQTEKKKYVAKITATYAGAEPMTREVRKVFRTVADPDGVYDMQPVAAATYTATKLPLGETLDVTSLVMAAIERYGDSHGLADITYDGAKFVDESNPNERVQLQEQDLLERLEATGHVTGSRNLAWDFCLAINVTLDASESTDPEGDDLTYGWTLESKPRSPVTVSTAFDDAGPVSTAMVLDLVEFNPVKVRYETVPISFGLVVNDLERDSKKEFVEVRIERDSRAEPILCDR